MNSSDLVAIKALGRPLHLGALYNARNDSFLAGKSLWDVEDIEKGTTSEAQPYSNFDITTSDSLSEKHKLLDVSASLQASFFAGLVEVGGSAQYLHDKASSKHQCRVTMKYQGTTEFKELKILGLNVKYPEVFNQMEATHVVVGILYGAEAFMVFEDTAADESEKQEIHGNLSVMIKKIPGIEISGEGKVEMNDEDKDMVKNMSCTFHGDFLLEQNPTSYEEAVLVYKELPTLLGKDGEKAVPVKVWLYPLNKLNDVAAQIKNMVSETQVSQLKKVMEDFHEAEMRSTDLLVKSAILKTDDIRDKLELFQTKLVDFTAVFLQKVAEMLPAIRDGTLEEKVLRDHLDKLKASGFSRSEMDSWLDEKETEIGVLSTYSKTMKYDIKRPGPELNVLLLDPEVDKILMFSFTSLKYEEEYLSTISQSTDNLQNNITIPAHAQNTRAEIPWYKAAGVKEVLLMALNNMRGYEDDVHLISYISDPNNPGASVRLYQDGICKDPNVQSGHVNILLDPNTVNKQLVISKNGKKIERVKEGQSYPDNPERFDYYEQALCKEGLTGNCWWEAEFTGGGLIMGMAYKSMSRKGSQWESCLGKNEKSWGLELWDDICIAWHDNVRENIPASESRRIRVYLDYTAGTLSFHSVFSAEEKLLYKFYAIFTEPFYPGFWLIEPDRSVSLF
ncbi:neoverrucotoxin subunit beta-like [Denticeps clupeoides]|uniref:neoverrucotoxin subunit beta-like n=1 Tax=Denticeps clupeoides TaxID=299321 RepID=UPI0010A2BE25|nr:neoverrucotoxin subunit beta-like [Denticeps clupeoides]